MNKLLIVNQSADFLEIIKNILECIGYTVKTRRGNAITFDDISEFEPELIILDIFLTCENANRDARVLVFSTSLEYLEDYNSYNADDFIEKPFDINQLIEKIKLVLHRQLVPLNAT